MFEIKFVVRDKHLADLLKYLKGMALEPPVVEPIDDDRVAVNPAAHPVASHIKRSEASIKQQARLKTGLKAVDEAKKWLDKNPKVVRFVPDTIKPLLSELGFAVASANYVTRQLWARGFLKKKSRGQYEVIRK